MTMKRNIFRKSASLFMSALLSLSVFSVASTLNVTTVSAVSYSEMSALDQYAYSGDDLGATYSKTSTTFKVWAPTASKVQIKRYTTGSDAESGAAVIETKDMTKGSQGIWSITISGDLNKTYYTYLVTANGVTNETVDIYARTTGVNGMRGMVVDLDSTDPAGWENDKRVDCPNQTDAIIWEVHVRDFSASSDSGMKNKGKFLAFTETGTTVNSDGVHPTGIDYLADLGVTHVHLLPAFDFDGGIDETKLSTDQFNWGYDPVNYNSPEGSFSTDPYHGEVRINEFKQMVQALHNKGIGVVLDVVYNHTYGKNDWFDFTVPDYYYRQNAKGTQSNGSGCGNETASDRAMFHKYMIDSIVYWAQEYHLDGFRFDLMGLHDCDTMNDIRAALDKIDPDILIYGEPWTAETTTCPKPTAVQGNMKLVSTDISAFNDKVRDAIKGSCFNAADPGFIQGAGFEEALKSSIQASTGTGQWSKQPSQTVTYTSAHDNYTLYDKLVFSCKGGSGYGNRYDDLVAMNKLAGGIILTSQGMSFFQAGEEFARTKYGDHNSYKSPTSTNQLVWSNTKTYADLLAYYKGLIQIRKAYSPFRDPTNTSNGTIYFSWANSGFPSGVVAFTMYNKLNPDTEWDYVAVLHNSNSYSQTVTLMTYDGKTLPSQWTIIADGSTAGIESLGTTGSTVTIPARSTMVLVDKTSFDRTVISAGGKVTVNHVIKSSSTTYKTETLKGKEGTSYTTSPLSELTSNGYTVASVSGQTTGTFTKAGTTVTYYYELDTTKYASITVKYQDAETGASIAPDDVQSKLIGSTYSVSPKTVKGYECDTGLTSNASGTVAQGGTTVIFKYHEAESETLKIHYYNSNGWSTVAMYVYTESGTTAKQLSGAWPGTVMTAESGGWYVGTVDYDDTALFIANNNNNGSQDPSGVGTSGYSVSGEVWIKGGKVYQGGKVNVRYVDQDNNVLGKETLTGIADGTTTYTTSAKTFTGYELVTTPTNASGLFTASDITVTYVYKLTSPVDPLSNDSSMTPASIKLGSSATVTCAASGGKTSYQYKVAYKGASDSSYTTVQDYSSNTSVKVTPKTEGTYSVVVTVKDSAGTTKEKSFSLTVTGDDPETLENNSTISSKTITLGSSVKVTGAASGGTKPYQYAVYYKKASSSSYTTVQSYSTSSSIEVTPTTAATYDIRVKVKDSAGTVKTKDFTVTVSSSGVTNTSTISSTSISLGSSVTVTASAKGGKSPYKYAVYYKKTSSDNYSEVQAYSTTSTIKVTPTTATTYDVRVKVKDSNGTVAKKDFTVTVKKAALTNNSTIGKTTISIGDSITVTAAASGGASPYKYAVYLKKASSDNYSEVRGYATGTSIKVTPTAATAYNILVKVKDSNGTIAKKTFTVTVTTSPVNKYTISSTSITLGQDITATAEGHTGVSPFKYAAYYKKSTDDSFTTLQGYSTTNKFIFTPQTSGTYILRMKIKDSKNSIVSKDYKINVSAPTAFTNLASIDRCVISLGETVTVTAGAVKGTKPYQYAISYKKASSSSYTSVQGYSTNKTVTIKPKTATDYNILVKAKDASGTMKSKTFTVTVK